MKKNWIAVIFLFSISCYLYSQENNISDEDFYLKTIASFSSNNLYLSLTTLSVIKQNIELENDTSRYVNYADVVNSVIFTLEDEIKHLGEILESQTLNKEDNRFLKEIIKTFYSMKENAKLLLKYLNSKKDEDFDKFKNEHKNVLDDVERLFSTNK